MQDRILQEMLIGVEVIYTVTMDYKGIFCKDKEHPDRAVWIIHRTTGSTDGDPYGCHIAVNIHNVISYRTATLKDLVTLKFDKNQTFTDALTKIAETLIAQEREAKCISPELPRHPLVNYT